MDRKVGVADMNINIIRVDGKRVLFRVSDEYGNNAYRTNADGEGLWINRDGEWKQITGTSQFNLLQKTDSGKRKAIRRFLDDGNNTFRW